ncbi:mannose-1-phosphate guanylyltransferase [Fulvitalea axinellae]|uniref:mannose-1-phosphate guanylyltransferase n=1 Tax=Fulvitalea axinellae TaxID=1182444 RepID=A0AAU9CXL5_9BACT|nr:mannose-1-phosphate guanylyltransferase [Fulvitalea axinellae]
MSNKNQYVVIMAGGVGSRFWPFSRTNRPKQFLDILGSGYSLLQMTYERFKSVCPPENVYIVTNEAYAGQVKEQLPAIGEEQLLTEPHRRNTAPCIAYACFKIASQNPDAQIIVTPSDHAIFKEAEFLATVDTALKAVKDSDKLVTIGITPSRPDTGYGYIQYLDKDSDNPVKRVKTFTEKPHRELAMKFLESGDFVWNAGIFIWNAKGITKAFADYLPEMAETFSEISGAYYTLDERRIVDEAYATCRNISIDYGIMEKSDNVFVVLGDFGWSDLGSWNSLHALREKDDTHNNVLDANALVYDSKDCMIVSHNNDRLIIVEGLESYLVADYEDVVLICNKNNEKKFREFVNDVKEKKGEHLL